MFLIFVYLMGYQPGRGLLLHGILGSTLLILFFVHHALNVRWYAGLGKGKYPPIRVFFLVIDFLLLAAMIGMAVSSILLSGDIFRFSPFYGTRTARTLHTLSTAWGFLLMLLHLGLHTHTPLEKLRKKASATIFAYAYYLFFGVVLATGIVCFARSDLWRSLFLLPGKSVERSLPVFYAEYAAVTVSACQFVHITMRLLQGRKKKNLDKENKI